MSSRRILIIDQDLQSGAALRELVAGWNYEVVLAQNNAEGLAQLGETTPSVIVADSAVSSSDGFGVLREIRALYPDIPVVLLTGKGSIEMALNAIQQEGHTTISKNPLKLRSCE